MAAATNGHTNGARRPAFLRGPIGQIKERFDAAWSLTGLPLPGVGQIDLDKLLQLGQATFARMRDALEAVTFRAANLDTDTVMKVPKKILARVRGLNGHARN